MNTSIESVERNLCKTLMEKLPFPAKETFLVAVQGGGRGPMPRTADGAFGRLRSTLTPIITEKGASG